MRTEGPQGEGAGLGSWAQHAGPTENQGSLVARSTGAAAGTLECHPRIIPAQGQQEPTPTRESEAMPVPLILDPFAHSSLLLMPWTRVTVREELITIAMSLLSQCQESQEALSASHSFWSCGCSGLCFDSVLPKEGGREHRTVGRT